VLKKLDKKERKKREKEMKSQKEQEQEEKPLTLQELSKKTSRRDKSLLHPSL